MSTEYKLNNTGPEVQERLDQVLPNKESIEKEHEDRVKTDEKLESDIKDLINRVDASEQKQEQLENSFKDIVLSGGGASTANAVTFDNSKSGLDSVSVQDAIDELVARKVYLTEDAYDRLVASGNVDPDVEYNVYEEE